MSDAGELVADLTLDAARVLTQQIRDSAVRALESLAEIEHAVAQAWRGRAWAALGYASWEAYATAEFSQTRLWGTVEERRERVSALRTAGLSTRAIAAVLGVSKSTPGRDLAELSGATDVATDGLGSVEGEDGKTYRTLRPMPAELLERKLNAAELHAGGLRQEEIATRLGVSQATVSADLSEMRRMADVAPEPIRAALTSQTLTRAEALEQLHDLVRPTVQLGPLAKRVIADVAASTRTLHRDIYMDDAWQDDAQRRAAATAIVEGGLGEVLIMAAELAAYISRADVDAEEHLWLRFTQSLGDANRILSSAARNAREDEDA